jgi:hypothetical protein
MSGCSRQFMLQSPVYVLFVVSVILCIAGAAIIPLVAAKRRTAWMRQAADELRFTFFPKGDAETLTLLSRFRLFSQGKRKEVLNLMRGVANSLEVRIFDYQYVAAGRDGADAPRQTVIAFRAPELNLPSFALRPKSVFHKIGTIFGYQDIAVANRPIFAKTYLLQGPSEPAIRELFDDQVLSFFEDQPGLSAEGGGFELIFYRAGALVPPEKIRSFLEEGFKVLDLFR